jgi:hypothetical protein
MTKVKHCYREVVVACKNMVSSIGISSINS